MVITWSHPAVRIMFATSFAVIGARDLSFCVFLGKRRSWYSIKGEDMQIDHRENRGIPRIRVARHNRGDSSSTSRLASGDEDQQLHKNVVHVRSTGGL